MRSLIQCLRTFFRRGRFRTFGSWALFLIAAPLLWLFGESFFSGIRQEFLTGSATLVAMLTLVCYNLRCRMMDYVLKVIPTEQRYEGLLEQARRCGNRLTNIALFSFFTSVVAVSSKCFPHTWLLSLVGAFLFVAIWQYLHVLFCFEEVEDFLLDTLKEEEGKKRKVRRIKEQENRKKEYPDT